MSRVMIIDDELPVRTLLRTILEQAGHSVSDAPDGRKGIELWRRAPTEVVITDMYMPVKDGVEVILEMTNHPLKPAIIAMSGGDEQGLVDVTPAALLLGADRVLSKPFDRHTFLSTVEEVLAAKVSANREATEQRKHARYPTRFAMSLDDGVRTLCGTVTDISLEGCRIQMQEARPQEQYFRLDIGLDDKKLRIDLAVMRWARGNECGVEFIRLSSGDQRRLHRLVRRYETASLDMGGVQAPHTASLACESGVPR